jgi:hypothetical protein
MSSRTLCSDGIMFIAMSELTDFKGKYPMDKFNALTC